MLKMLSNGNYAGDVKDFDQVMEQNDFDALQEIYNQQIKNFTENNAFYKTLYEEEELHSDALHTCNVNGYNDADAIINYINNAKRLDRKALVAMLRDLQNSLENY